MKKVHRNNLLNRLILSVLGVLVSVTLLTGVAMAWFTNQYRLSSVGKIHPLTYISILAPGDTVIQSIDLSYDKSEVHDGKVQLKRPLIIRSEEEIYDLCIAHTTNISGLTISLYRANDNGTAEDAYISGITEKGTPYYWNKSNEVNLFDENYYCNKKDNSNDRVLADQDNQAHLKTFQLSEQNTCYNNVQKYAEPLYWVMKNLAGEQRTPGSDFYSNYILEITWDETDKETDILYVIAQNSQTNNEGGDQS